MINASNCSKYKYVGCDNLNFIHNKSRELDSLTLQYLQLLCENHNDKLQNYLRFQPNFKKGYDLVEAANNYLQILFKNYNNPDIKMFESLIRSFDLLIEFIQGPCLENQILLINSKLMITISEILSIYEDIEIEEESSTIKNLYKFQLFSNPQIAILAFKVNK